MDKAILTVPCISFTCAVGEHVAVIIVGGLGGGGWGWWSGGYLGIYLRVLVERVAAVGFGIGVGGWIVYIAFGGIEAVAYGVVAVAARKGVLDIVCGVYHFAACVVVEDVCACSAAGGASHGGGKLCAGGIANAIKGSAALGAGNSLAHGVNGVVVLADDAIGVGAGGEFILLAG